MVQALALAFLVLSGHAAVGPILLLNLLLGAANAVDVPVRQSFVIEMVAGGEDLPNAIALNSSIFNLARLVGPSLAGVLIALVGEGWVFLLNGLSYLAVIAALLAIRVQKRPKGPASEPELWAHLGEGLKYVGGFRPIRAVLLLLAAVNLLGVPSTVLLPIIAGDVLHGGAHTLGFLTAAIGVGALCGALYMASRRSVLGLGRLILFAVSVFSLSLMGLALCRTEWLAVPVLMATGLGMMIHMASSNTLLQTLVDPEKRGRVMSFYAVAFMGPTRSEACSWGRLRAGLARPGRSAFPGFRASRPGSCTQGRFRRFGRRSCRFTGKWGSFSPEAARVAPFVEGVDSRRT